MVGLKNTILSFAIMVTSLAVGTVTHAQDETDLGALNPEYGVQEDYNTAETYINHEVSLSENTTSKTTSSVGMQDKTKKEQTNETDSLKNSSGSAASGYGNDESQSVLSFNFLYYIIQKFKFAEVVDQ